ncbi:hypothetical protein ARD30_20025 [Bosea thiooxidans]|uniref:ATP-dependent DNA ligase family profile domain-containing protein n=1 Tax=Bosea thiooxidans TaxID=53254 RepID=A0A0Q3I2K2_9HYPH|nr:hypothetical protein [Bosea thiooxidans]KQK29104.1 hypothetical protein ARD30_20025 [Bosea thiooxidans]
MGARQVLSAGLAGDTIQEPLTRRRKVERDLFTDPMPERIEPCLALLTGTIPNGADWSYEVKWDGYRLAIYVLDRHVRIVTRGGHDWTSRFLTLAHDVLELGVDSAILDGEAVVLDERDAADFVALQKALGGKGGKRFATEGILYAFDLLYVNGRDLRALGCEERGGILEDFFGIIPHSSIRMSEDINASGPAFLKLGCDKGLEGIIAKRRSAPYRSSRGGETLKVKCVQSERFVSALLDHRDGPRR